MRIEFSVKGGPNWGALASSAGSAVTVWSAARLGEVPDHTALYLALVTLPGSLLTQTLASRTRTKRP